MPPGMRRRAWAGGAAAAGAPAGPPPSGRPAAPPLAVAAGRRGHLRSGSRLRLRCVSPALHRPALLQPCQSARPALTLLARARLRLQYPRPPRGGAGAARGGGRGAPRHDRGQQPSHAAMAPRRPQYGGGQHPAAGGGGGGGPHRTQQQPRHGAGGGGGNQQLVKALLGTQWVAEVADKDDPSAVRDVNLEVRKRPCSARVNLAAAG
jgi:hypothetical protein